jgi:hypothetical protein
MSSESHVELGVDLSATATASSSLVVSNDGHHWITSIFLLQFSKASSILAIVLHGFFLDRYQVWSPLSGTGII